jgi:hypothetical protein
LFEHIEKEDEETCLYKRLLLDYTYGLGSKFSFRKSRSFISSDASWKSCSSLFSRIRSSCMDFGITTALCCKLQRIRTWASVLPYFFAPAKIVGWLSLLLGSLLKE